MQIEAVFLSLGIFTAFAAAEPPDSAAVRSTVAAYVEARQHTDPAAVEALFTADADQLVSTGEWRKGRPAVVAGTVASTRNSSGARTVTLESVRFLSPTVAIADGRYEIAGPHPRSMWTCFVLTRQGAGWRIAAIRNMLPAPPSPR